MGIPHKEYMIWKKVCEVSIPYEKNAIKVVGYYDCIKYVCPNPFAKSKVSVLEYEYKNRFYIRKKTKYISKANFKKDEIWEPNGNFCI